MPFEICIRVINLPTRSDIPFVILVSLCLIAYLILNWLSATGEIQFSFRSMVSCFRLNGDTLSSIISLLNNHTVACNALFRSHFSSLVNFADLSLQFIKIPKEDPEAVQNAEGTRLLSYTEILSLAMELKAKLSRTINRFAEMKKTNIHRFTFESVLVLAALIYSTTVFGGLTFVYIASKHSRFPPKADLLDPTIQFRLLICSI